jgi:hypothetical protein
LSENDYLNLSHEFGRHAPPILVRFSDVIGDVLVAKASAMALTELMNRNVKTGA